MVALATVEWPSLTVEAASAIVEEIAFFCNYKLLLREKLYIHVNLFFLSCSGVIVAFVVSPLLMVVTSASYGLATVVLKVCNELRPPEYSILREVADDPSLWGGVTLVGVITEETFVTTVNLSIVQTLRYVCACIYFL